MADGRAAEGAGGARLQCGGGSPVATRRPAHLCQDCVRRGSRTAQTRGPDTVSGRSQPVGAHPPAGRGSTQVCQPDSDTHSTVVDTTNLVVFGCYTMLKYESVQLLSKMYNRNYL